MDNIVFNCTTCNLGVVFNSEEHDHSACDESGDNWYCPNCIPDDDDDDGLTWFETQVLVSLKSLFKHYLEVEKLDGLIELVRSQL